MFHLLLLVNVLCYCSLVSFAGAYEFFGQANEGVSNARKNDRPCNFLLGYEDAYLTTPKIIEKYGYPVERHWVTTDDGYILEMHRIRKDPGEDGKPSQGVFLMHGVLSSSRDFVINCDKRALAFQLWDNGYDVWIGNYRGNPYGLNHTVLNPDNFKFWDFSVDEIGFYDVPAMIDYVLETTRLKKVSYVGHSMGNGVGLIMLSVRPEYNNKINFWFAMSASATLGQTSSTFLKIISSFPRTWELVMTKLNRGKLFPPFILKFIHRHFPYFCRREGRSQNYHGLCVGITYFFDGYDPGQMPPQLWTVLAGEIPTATSVKFLCQWMQWIISGEFAMYDEGPLKNLRKYGSVKPKLFPIENMNVSTILFWGENDWIVSPESIKMTEDLVKKLRPETSSVEFFKVASPHWNHMDFIYGKDADIYVYSHILHKLRSLHDSATTATT